VNRAVFLIQAEQSPEPSEIGRDSPVAACVLNTSVVHVSAIRGRRAARREVYSRPTRNFSLSAVVSVVALFVPAFFNLSCMFSTSSVVWSVNRSCAGWLRCLSSCVEFVRF
jgi:hypothetical protein